MCFCLYVSLVLSVFTHGVCSCVCSVLDPRLLDVNIASLVSLRPVHERELSQGGTDRDKQGDTETETETETDREAETEAETEADTQGETKEGATAAAKNKNKNKSKTKGKGKNKQKGHHKYTRSTDSVSSVGSVGEGQFANEIELDEDKNVDPKQQGVFVCVRTHIYMHTHIQASPAS